MYMLSCTSRVQPTLCHCHIPILGCLKNTVVKRSKIRANKNFLNCLTINFCFTSHCSVWPWLCLLECNLIKCFYKWQDQTAESYFNSISISLSAMCQISHGGFMPQLVFPIFSSVNLMEYYLIYVPYSISSVALSFELSCSILSSLYKKAFSKSVDIPIYLVRYF